MRKIRTSILRYFNSVPFDICVSDRGTHIKVIREYQFIDKYILHEYEKVGNKFLDISDYDSITYFDYIIKKLEDNSQKTIVEKINLLKESSRLMMQSIFHQKNIDEYIFKQAQIISKKVIEYTSESESVIDLLIDREESDEDSFESSLATSFLSLLFLDRFKINSKEAKEILSLGGLLHDIGKSKIPPEVLNKPGRFTPEERKIMEEHPRLGVNMIKQISNVPPEVIQIILQHHEDWNGRGYPAGYREKEIYILAHLTSIIDVFTALICKRTYKPSYTPKKAVEIMIEMRGKFNPEMLKDFVSVFRGGTYYVRQIEKMYGLKPLDKKIKVEYFSNTELFNLVENE